MSSTGGGIVAHSITVNHNGVDYTFHEGDEVYAVLVEILAARKPDEPPENPCGGTSTE